MNSRNKRGALEGAKLILSIFIIAILLIVFYIWVGNNITAADKNQAESIATSVELQNFFSELIDKHGIEIADKDASSVETIIEDYAKNYMALPSGSYSTSCTATKDCTLSITSKEPLHVVASWSLNIIVNPVWLLFKTIGLNVMQDTSQEAYLPVKLGKAIKFKLTMKVKWG